MLTANFVRYWDFEMKPEYIENSGREVPYAPLDCGSIDAPECIAAGSYEAYTGTNGWKSYLPSTVSRGR